MTTPKIRIKADTKRPTRRYLIGDGGVPRYCAGEEAGVTGHSSTGAAFDWRNALASWQRTRLE